MASRNSSAVIGGAVAAAVAASFLTLKHGLAIGAAAAAVIGTLVALAVLLLSRQAVR